VGGLGVVDREETRRRASRLAAPLAFFLGATILIVLVQSGLEGGETTTEASQTATLVTGPGPTTTTDEPARRRFYRVKAGDTLESIAAKFDTTVNELLELNPDIDPLALSPRQRIRVA
jgi:LysM repeat protein